MTWDDLQLLRESVDFEAKAAQGRDGTGAVPDSLWATYSALANTNGGIVVLGVREEDDRSLTPVGLMSVDRVLTDFWNTINNSTKVNRNILNDGRVHIVGWGSVNMIAIDVPRASRSDRPIFVGANPFTGTYRRNFDGDYLCDENTVRRMIADSTQDTRDDQILDGFGMDDLDESALASFRNEFRSTRPGHPWISLGDVELLRSLGGWRRDRSTGAEGLTFAGILMFGHLRSILDAFPNYVIDFQERPDERSSRETRWLDRVTTDGTWSGNLFDFYRRVYPKMTASLRVPFQLRDGKRVDETHVHEALREALVNTLIHADFSGTTSISVLAYPHKFVFRNPGGLRLPLDIILAGGTSDCRNRNLQKMFQMVGAVEQAGSGVPKILRAWREQDWFRPLWRERLDPDMTQLEMGMQSLLPAASLEALIQRFGVEFDRLDHEQRLAVVIAHAEGAVTNQRLQEVTSTHPTDLTRILRVLVGDGLLIKVGVGRGTSYELPSVGSQGSLFDKSPSKDSHMNEAGLETMQPRTLTEQVEADIRQVAVGAVDVIKAKGRTLDKQLMERAILEVCEKDYHTVREIATAIGRSAQTLRAAYLPDLVASGRLELRYPQTPNHPRQAYKASVKN